MAVGLFLQHLECSDIIDASEAGIMQCFFFAWRDVGERPICGLLEKLTAIFRTRYLPAGTGHSEHGGIEREHPGTVSE